MGCYYAWGVPPRRTSLYRVGIAGAAGMASAASPHAAPSLRLPLPLPTRLLAP